MTDTPASEMPDVKDCPAYLYLNRVGDGLFVWDHDEPKQGYVYKYIRADKHTALERVAKEMAEALKLLQPLVRKCAVPPFAGKLGVMYGVAVQGTHRINEALAAYEKLMEGK